MAEQGIGSSVGFIALTMIVLDPEIARAAAVSASGVQLGYIDPGSGSFILQAVVAAVAGAAVAVNAYWKKIKQILGIGSSEAEEDATDSESRDV